MGNDPNAEHPSGQFSTVQWLMAWAVLILVLWLFNKTKIGHVLIYYSLVLLIIFVIVTQYAWFVGVLKPFSAIAPGLVANQQPGETPGQTSIQDTAGGEMRGQQTIHQ